MAATYTNTQATILGTAPMGLSTTSQPPHVDLRVGCWNIQDFGSGFAGWNPWPGVESDVTGHASFAHCETQWRTSTDKQALAERADELGRLYRYLKWRQRLYDLADHILHIDADVVVLLEMRTRGRPRAETGPLTATYATAMGWILGYVADMAGAAGNAAELEFRKDRITQWEDLVNVTCTEEWRLSDDRQQTYNRGALERIIQQRRKNDGQTLSAKNKALLRDPDVWSTWAERYCMDSVADGGWCARMDRALAGIGATADAGTAWKHISPKALSFVTTLVNDIAGCSAQATYSEEVMYSLLRDILEAEEAARPTGSMTLSNGTGRESKEDDMDTTADAPPLCEALLTHVRFRIAARRRMDLKVDVTVQLLDLGHKSGETVAVVCRNPWKFHFIPDTGAKLMGDATYERPAYVINLMHSALRTPPIIIVAAHAPAPNHYCDTKWYANYRNALVGQSNENAGSVVIAVGDFNVTTDLTLAETLFANLLPAASVHVHEKTSYAMTGSGDSRWSQPYDKILLWNHRTCPRVTYDTAIRRGGWTTAEAAREFSDHTWISRKFKIRLG